jgi:hypothetical protein
VRTSLREMGQSISLISAVSEVTEKEDDKISPLTIFAVEAFKGSVSPTSPYRISPFESACQLQCLKTDSPLKRTRRENDILDDMHPRDLFMIDGRIRVTRVGIGLPAYPATSRKLFRDADPSQSGRVHCSPLGRVTCGSRCRYDIIG